MKTNTILKIAALCVICAAMMMSGCIAPTGEWNLDGTLIHTENETTTAPGSTPTPNIPTPIPTPTPNLCSGVTCTPECYGSDLYRSYCVDGICVRGSLLEDNSVRCGYVAPTPTPTPTPDPCDGVVCGQKCIGFDLYDTFCQDGRCVTGSLIRRNSGRCGYVVPTPTPEPTPKNCNDLDQSILKRYDVDGNGQIDDNWVEMASIDLDASRMTQSDYDQIKYAYEHNCPVDRPIVDPTPEPTPAPSTSAVINIEPPIYSGVVRNNGEILDIRITPDPLIAGGDVRVEVDILNTGTVKTCYEIHWYPYDHERWIYSGDMETHVFTSRIDDPGDRNWDFYLYWDAEWPASNVLLQTATADVYCYTQYEVDNM